MGTFSTTSRSKLDFQVENQPRAAFVPIYQYPSQKMSELKFFFVGGAGGNPDNVRDTLTRTMSEIPYKCGYKYGGCSMGGAGQGDILPEMPLKR